MGIRHVRSRAAVSVLAVAAVAVGALVGADAAAAAPSVSITPVLGGLGSPRGIAFDGQGSMYVAESGVAGGGLAGLTNTGKVDKYAWGSSTPAWTTGFNSLYTHEAPPPAPPDVLGPEGISAVGNGCMKHSQGQRNGCQVMMITSESTPGILDATGGAVNDPQAGHLYRLDGASGAATAKSDVGSQMYQWTGDHSSLFSDFPDSNPYGVLVTKDPQTDEIRTFVADAGANTISEIMPDGTARVVSYIPNEQFGAFRDRTPTCIAQGPDGFLYVGTLDFVSNLFVPPGLGGHSSVWRVDPNASFPTAPTQWATGLTTVTACTFDRQGNFWAAEMFAGGLQASPPGDVVRIPFADPTTQAHFGLGQLPTPGGIAQGPDGAMYVTVGSSAPPNVRGGVMRVAVSG